MLEVLEQGMASLFKFKRYRTLVKEIESILEKAYRKAPLDKSVINKGREIQAKVHQSHHQFDEVFHHFIDFSRPHIDQAIDEEITEAKMAEQISLVASSVTRSSTLDELIDEVIALKEEAVALLDGAGHNA
ncbi:MAG: hypothetical protein ACYS6K_20055 [Planctomycetota bacterium]|jgi:hypothetical protein